MKKIILFSSFIVFFLAVSISPVFAKGYVAANNYTLAGNEVSEKNLYAAGNTINIFGKVNGDLVAAAGNIFISGEVLKDVAACGGTIDFRGKTGEDVRITGGNLIINGKIGGEVIAIGGNISFLSNSDIKGDVFVAGGNIIIDGTIGGSLTVSGGVVQINGKVQGDITVKKTEDLTIGEKTVIGGKLDYSSPKEIIVPSGAKINGGVNFKKIEPKILSEKGGKENAKGKKIGIAGVFGFFGVWWFIKLLMVFITAFVLYFVLSKKIQKIVSQSISKFWVEAFRGFVIMVVLPVAIIISFVSVIGVILGFAGLCFYAFFTLLASAFSAIVAGSLISKYIFKTSTYETNWKTITIGVLIIQIVRIIPFVGWLVSLVFFLVAFGVLVNHFYQSFRKIEE